MPHTSPTFLLASADPDLPERVNMKFVGAGARVEVALTAEATLAAATGINRPDLVFLDAALPNMPIAQLLTAIRAAESDRRLPIVLIADSITQEWLTRLAEGVLDDLIPRDAEPAYWRFRADCTLRSHRILYELGNLRDNESRNAQYDRLTGVYNREALLSLLFSETDRVQRQQSQLTLVLFDVDDFGHWNARLGVDACDQMLCEMVRRTARLLRSYDQFGRTGKDEFSVALPGCSVTNAVTLAERLRLEVFSTPYRVSSEFIRLSACFGIAHSHGRSPVIVLREAEQALARAKQAGPESIQIFDEPPRPAPAPVTFLLPTSGEELLVW